MSTLYLIRHGQARFMTDDYDRLSDLGRLQSRLVGEYMSREGIRVDRLWTGDLVRQKDTAADAAAATVETDFAWPEAGQLSGLNEYPAEDIQGRSGPSSPSAIPSSPG